MKKEIKVTLIVAGVAVAAYLAYRWYASKKAQGSNPFGVTSGLGSNLNSVNPIGRSSFDNSGLNYYGGSVNINVTEPVKVPPPPKHVHHPPVKPPDHDHEPKPKKNTPVGNRKPGGPPPVRHGPRHPVHTAGNEARVMPRTLNKSSVSTSYAQLRTPTLAKPGKPGVRT